MTVRELEPQVRTGCQLVIDMLDSIKDKDRELSRYECLQLYETGIQIMNKLSAQTWPERAK